MKEEGNDATHVKYVGAKPWSLAHGERLNFTRHLVFLLVASGLPCVGVIVLWSSIGYGEEAFQVLDAGSWLSYAFFGISALALTFLYLADFFWPPHLPGRYCVLGANDRQAGRWMLASAFGLLVLGGLFLAKTYPRVPVVVTVLCGPVLMMCLRGLTQPQDPHRRVGHNVIRSLTLDKRLIMLRTIVYAEKEANGFYHASAVAFAISGVATLVVWTVWFASSNRNCSEVTQDEIGFNFLAAPVFAGVANLLFSLFVLIRVWMARVANDYDTTLLEIIHEGGTDLNREICNESILGKHLQEHHVLDDFRNLPVDAQVELGKQHAHHMKILSNVVKAVGCGLLLLIGAAYIAAELVAAESHIARLAMGLLVVLFVTFVVLTAIWFRRLFAHMRMWMQHLPLWRMTLNLASNDWVRAGAVTAVLPYAPAFLLLSAINHAIRRCRGLDITTALGSSKEGGDKYFTGRVAMALDAMRTWDWLSMTEKIYVWGFAMIGYVLFPKLLNVLLAWLISLLQGLNFYIIIFSTLAAGLSCFLLPPVPGVPVYLFGGFVIAAACHPSDDGTRQLSPSAPNGFAFGCIIATGIGFLLKLLACAMQQKLIGERLGSSLWVKQQVGIHKPFFRAVEAVLRDRGYTLGKVSVLCGGPDWPTSVLAGILRVPLVDMELGTIPIIFFVVPCVLTGAFYVRKPESDFWESAADLMLSSTLFVNLALWVGAAWAIQEKLEQKHWELSKPLLQNVDLDWLDYRSRRLNEASAIRLDIIPSVVLVLFRIGCVVVVLIGHAFYWVPTFFFTSFEVNSDIKTLTWLGNGGLFLFPGLGGVCLALVGLCGWINYACWRRVQQQASRMAEAEKLGEEEQDWKANRRKQALEASGMSCATLAHLSREAWNEPEDPAKDVKPVVYESLRILVRPGSSTKVQPALVGAS